MSMDALTAQALKSLLEEAPPKLQEQLALLAGQAVGDRTTSDGLEKCLSEAIDLLQLMHTWTGAGEHSLRDTDLVSGEEADALLKGVGEEVSAAQGSGLSADDVSMLATLESDRPLGDSLETSHAEDMMQKVADDEAATYEMSAADGGSLSEPSETDDARSSLLSDEDARARLAEMDGLSNVVVAKVPKPQDEISDADAEAMLAQMDGEQSSSGADSEEMSDADAEAMLAQMDGEQSSSGGDSEEMSDADAEAMLAQMDGEQSSSGGDSEEMSDADAEAMLAQMDGSASGAKIAKSSGSGDGSGSSVSATSGEGSSAEDDAEALLAKLGGDDDDSGSAVQEGQGASEAVTVDGYEVTEVEEWEPNDFQTDPDMVNDFNVNSDEIMESLDEQLLKLEQDPESKAIIEEIFRAAHTLKGAAGMFGFRGLERVMHRMENLFDLVRKEKLSPTAEIVDVMFEGLDVIRILLGACKEGKPCGAKTGEMVMRLEMLADGKNPPGIKPQESSQEVEQPSEETKIVAKQVTKDTRTENDAAEPKKKGGAASEKKKEQSTIRVDLNRLDALVNLVGELVIDRTRFVTIEEELRTMHPEVKLSGNISETVLLFGRHMNEIQDIIMKVRMVPIGNAFNKYPRIIRDLSKQLGKKITLHISGENAELDKTLVEQIGDPLIHLIRNSCDHGVELPDVRVESGKSEMGNIWLSAHQEGNHIVITIEDDGKGIPAEIIRKKGIEKGLISEDDKLSNREIFNLIFEPGFSTAEQVTNVSGRGVGMDVVKKQIMKLKGLLEVDSEQGKGTTITIRLPLTLAIVQSLLVRAKEEVFAIPLSSVIESIRIEPSEIQKVGDADVIKLRDKVLPLMYLHQELNLTDKKRSIVRFIHDASITEKERRSLRKGEKYFVVVVGQPDRPFGILVDQLLNQQEMVIKSMGRVMKDVSCVAGGAVLGNGEVVLVLDIPELEESFRSKSRMAA